MTAHEISPPQAQSSQPTLSDVALQLNATLELDKLLHYSANAASVLAESDATYILLPDEKGYTLQLKAQHSTLDQPLKLPFQDPIKVTLSLEGGILQTGQAHILTPENAEEWAFWSEQGVQHVLYMPMVSRRETVGVLVLCYLKLHEFSKYELKTLRQLASHAAVAIENARTYADSQSRSFELAVIMDATEAVNSTLSLPQVLSLIGKNLKKALHLNWCEVLILDNAAQHFFTLSSQRTATWNVEDTITLKLAHPLERQPIILEHKNTALTAAEKYLLGHGHQTWLIPLYDNDTVLGMLQVSYLTLPSHDPKHAFNTPQLQTLIREITGRLNDQDTGRTLHLMWQVLRDAQADGSRLWRYDPAAQQFQLKADESNLVWHKTGYPSRSIEDYPSLRNCLARQMFHNVVIDDFNLPEDLQRLMQDLKLRAVLILPFTIQDEKQGLMLMGDTQRTGRFEKRELSLAQSFVLQAANALKNAFLFEDLQNSLEELRRTQAKLVQTARLSAIGELAAAVAHQINNPLTTVLGDTQLLLEDTPPTDPRYEGLKAVHRAGQRAYEVVRRLLTMSRQKTPNELPELMNINATIENTLALVRDTLQRSRIKVEVNLAATLPKAFGLSGQLEDVWLNLLLNARDAVRPISNPLIAIASSYDVGLNVVTVTIADNGPGLGNADPIQIFDAFYTTKPAGEGTGLGLYICATVVERCGGKIKVGTSSYNGAMFTVNLPCQPIETTVKAV